MTQRRMPSGQGPARRSGTSGRPGTPRTRATGQIRVDTRPTVRLPRGGRPAASRRTQGSAGGAATKRTAAPRPRALTGRATVLLAAFIALALAYTIPIRTYMQQQSQIAEMEAAQASQQAEIDATRKELEKWNDSEYVRIQAREKYFYVRPGEIPLLVYEDPDGAARDAKKNAPAATPDRWYDTLWNSVQAADAEPAN
ncbi:septum formation initiator family protein [Actinoplanes sp. NPDC051851]|uniref:FtsB family cell division protein n=1 Tax=Actinoplanes sp. NPDC051851 TaxID=3154753 RepID=UPI00342601A5